MRAREYVGDIERRWLTVRSSAPFSGVQILKGIRAEVLEEAGIASGVSGFACLPSESYQEYVDVLPSVWGGGLFEGFPDVVVWGFWGNDTQALGYPEDVSVHGDDPAPCGEHEGNIGCLGSDAGEAHEVRPRLGEGFLHYVVEGAVEACQDLLGDPLEHLAPLVVQSCGAYGFGDGLEGGVGEVLGGYADHLFEASVGC